MTYYVIDCLTKDEQARRSRVRQVSGSELTRADDASTRAGPRANIPPPATGLLDGLPGRTGRLLRALADLVVPPVCLDCRAPLADHDSLCPACWRQIDFIRPPLCDRLGIPLPFDAGDGAISAAAAANPPAYDRARAVAVYDGAMKQLVHGFKYHDRQDATHLLGRWMLNAGTELLADADLLVPVPLSRTRLLWRRFNQSALLARELSRLTGLPFDPFVLRRTRRTRPQVGLTLDQRRLNVRGAFAISPRRAALVDGARVVLVEDVVTTGATVEACARVLRRAGAARVDVLALGLVTRSAHLPA